MNNFRTPIQIIPSNHKIGYKERLFLVGSCFTDNIGGLLEERKFNVCINPFGVVYNPISVARCLDLIIQNKYFSKKDLHFHNNQWFSFFHHSRFSSSDADTCLEKINDKIKNAHGFLRDTNFLIISLGTAWVYEYIPTQQIVSNCHKIPSKEFNRFRLSEKEIIISFSEMIDKLLIINPKLKIIFTVSPIRHLKDGLHENQLSKSTLFLTVEELCGTYQHVSYFPSYEIVMDDLRDYRFYADDMVHLNETAINYIWKCFWETYFSDETKSIVDSVENILSAVQHKPFDMNSEKYKIFVYKTLQTIEMLTDKYLFLEFKKEQQFLNKMLI